MLPELNHEEILRYSRHLLIPEVGLEGQRKLKAASILVIGTGGLGSPVALYLAAAGVGRIGLVDYDIVDYSNLQRQVIHGTSTIDTLKVESARERMQDLNPDIQVDVYNEPFTSANAMRIVVKEVTVGGMNGVVFAILMGVVAALWFSSVGIGVVIAAAMVVNMLVAGVAGMLIPIGLSRMGIDPAISATVFLTTITDVVGFFAFLGLAALFLL